MTESTPPPPPPAASPVAPPPAPGAAPAAPKRILAILALVFGGLAFIFGIIPSTAGITWLFAVAAIVLAIIALVRKVKPTWFSLVGLGLAVVGWIIGIAVVLSGLGHAISTAVDDGVASASAAASAPAAPSTPPKDDAAGIGQTVTNNKNVAFTVHSVDCGIATAGPQFFTDTAKGQFCEVKYTVANGSTDKISLFASDLTGLIGTSTYDSDTKISTFNGDFFSTDVNPGLSADADVFIDIPAGASLNYLVYKPEFSILTSPIKVKVS